MADTGLIFHAIGRITSHHDRTLNAIVTRFFDTNDEHGVVLPSAVRVGLEYATENGVKNWIVDVSEETSSMSEKDANWESSHEFRQIFRLSSVRNILLLVSPSKDGQSLDSERAWAEGFAGELGEGFRADVASSASEVSEIIHRWGSAS